MARDTDPPPTPLDTGPEHRGPASPAVLRARVCKITGCRAGGISTSTYDRKRARTRRDRRRRPRRGRHHERHPRRSPHHPRAHVDRRDPRARARARPRRARTRGTTPARATRRSASSTTRPSAPTARSTSPRPSPSTSSSSCRASCGTTWSRRTTGCPAATASCRPPPHMTFVRGADNADYLRRRVRDAAQAPRCSPTSSSAPTPRRSRGGLPLLVGRPRPVGSPSPRRARRPARTSTSGASPGAMFDDAVERGARLHHRVRDHEAPPEEGRHRPLGRSTVADTAHRRAARSRARFVFVGAGGGALPLLQSVGHPRGQGLRRLPGQRQVPAHHEPRARRRAPGQGLRPGRRRRAADVGAAPGHPRDRRRHARCCSARTPASPRSSSRTGSICDLPPSRSGRTTSARCSASRAREPGR